MRRTPSMWKGSPECEAQASASSSPSRGRPASSIASACNGLLHERGSIGPCDVTGGCAHRTVGVQRHPGPVVVALHEPGTDDLGDDDGSNHARDGIRRPVWHDCPVPAPQYCPTQRELDDLELLLSGALAPRTTFDVSDPGITLALPPELADAPEVELVDPEGLPLAPLHRRVPHPPRDARLRPVPAAAPHPGPGPRAVRRRADRPRRSPADRTGPRADRRDWGHQASCCSPSTAPAPRRTSPPSASSGPRSPPPTC